MSNREKIECAGQCQLFTITIQGGPIAVDYYVLPVAACQLVLGVQWLETFGPIKTDYKQLSLTFQCGGVSHTFQGLKQVGMEALTDKEFGYLQFTLC